MENAMPTTVLEGEFPTAARWIGRFHSTSSHAAGDHSRQYDKSSVSRRNREAAHGPGMILQQDNARPYIANVVRTERTWRPLSMLGMNSSAESITHNIAGAAEHSPNFLC